MEESNAVDDSKTSSSLDMLRDLVADPDLEKLESIVDEFNIFDALGIINVEIRHSRFLSWLLDPTGSHGLGDYFLRMFLKRVAEKSQDGPTIFDVDIWDLGRAEVTPEWNKIDILIVSEREKCLCVVENKIWSTEHSNQLARYKKMVNEAPGFADYHRLFVYLTVSGETPSDSDYVSMGYGEVLNLLSHLLEYKRGELGSDVLTLIEHYDSMLRRYIMEDSKVQETCRALYKKHKKAFDLVFQYKPDKLQQVHDQLLAIVEKDPELILDAQAKTYVDFMPKDMDLVPRKGKGWGTTDRILLFEFKNAQEGVNLYLMIGPGDNEIRGKLHRMALSNRELFKQTGQTLYNQNTIYKRSILSAKKYEGMTVQELHEALEEAIARFKTSDLPMIKEELSKVIF